MDKSKVKLKVDGPTLKMMLGLSLDEKIRHTISRFLEYYIRYRGHVYLSFSGGKDSQTLAHIIDSLFRGERREFVERELFLLVEESRGHGSNLYEDLGIDPKSKGRIDVIYDLIILKKAWGLVPKVFCDTGLEYPEIRKHVKLYGSEVVWMRPKMQFPDVLKNIGVAVGSKRIAMQIRRLKEYLANPSEKNKATRTLYQTGIKRDGTKSGSFGLSKKWLKYLDAPFKVSDKCCDIFKKEPFRRYEMKTGRYPITATTASESVQRRAAYMQTGCNTFKKGSEMSRPFSIWKDEDTWAYAKMYGLRFAEVYYDRSVEVKEANGELKVIQAKGEKRTGCMFCDFGLHLEAKDKLNRVQRMAITHPKQHDFLINKCNKKEVYEWMGIDYLPPKKEMAVQTSLQLD